MPCNCGGGVPSKWELTTPDGEKRIYLTETESRVALTMAGGGTIRRMAANEQPNTS